MRISVVGGVAPNGRIGSLRSEIPDGTPLNDKIARVAVLSGLSVGSPRCGLAPASRVDGSIVTALPWEWSGRSGGAYPTTSPGRSVTNSGVGFAKK